MSDPQALSQSTLDEILAIIKEAADLAVLFPNPAVQAGAGIAEALLAIVQKSVSAYESHVGQPLDMTLIHRIDPIA